MCEMKKPGARSRASARVLAPLNLRPKPVDVDDDDEDDDDMGVVTLACASCYAAQGVEGVYDAMRWD